MNLVINERNYNRVPAKRLTLKQRKALTAYIEYGTPTKAGMSLGVYKDKVNAGVAVSGLLSGDNVKQHMEQILESAGLGKDCIARKLVALTDAKKTISATHNGIITDTMEVPDNEARIRALQLAGRYHGLENKTTEKRTVHVAVDLTGMSDEELLDLVAMGIATDGDAGVVGKGGGLFQSNGTADVERIPSANLQPISNPFETLPHRARRITVEA